MKDHHSAAVPKHFARALIALVGVLLIAGCTPVQEVPLVSDELRSNNATLSEQRQWVGEQFEVAVKAAQVPDGWYFTYIADIVWPRDRVLLLSGLSPGECGSLGTRRVDTSLRNDNVQDEFEAAKRVRAFWEAEGWTVTDIVPESSTYVYFRADNEIGAELALQAGSGGLTLEAATACSAHDSVVHWLDDLGKPNVFQDEIDRRAAMEE